MFLGKKPAHIASLQDKHVFVTGGSSGIGFELAKLCLSKGAYVTLISKTHTKLVKAHQLLTDTMGYPANRIRFEV
jgi:3-dehydrosphinganine reductase